MDMTSIGKNIRHFRNLKNISQESLAEKTDLSTNYISMIERGEKIPSLTSLIRFKGETYENCGFDDFDEYADELLI